MSVQLQADPVHAAVIGAEWEPKTALQRLALESDADILCMGGAAGSLKTSTLLADAIAERELPGSRMRALIFRRTYDELTELIDMAYDMYSQTGATYNQTAKTWRWPWGPVLRFRHLDKPKHKYKYQGHQASFVGFDESTHWEEEYPRYLLTRMRSTDANLRIRMRLATNPGNIGGAWHKHVFLRGVCPHCVPDRGPVPGKKYTDATWLKDKEPIELSVAYVPGRITDHQFFGPANTEYIKRLRTQSPATAAALLAGCWQAFEGQYFDCMSERDETGKLPWNKIKRQLVKDEWWWPHWVGCDFGFSVSHAVALLFTMGPDGRIYIVDYYIAQKERPDLFAAALAKRWLLDDNGKIIGAEAGREWQWQGWFLSPDCFDDRDGSSKNRAQQMNEVLERYGLCFIKGTNDRAGAATNIYRYLATGMLTLASPNCDDVYDALQTRVHDPDKQDDFKKVQNDPDDDRVDATKIGLYSWILAGRKPKEDRIAEAVKDMDPVNAFITGAKLQAEIEREEDSPGLSTGGGTAGRRGWTLGKSGARPPGTSPFRRPRR